MTNRPMARRQMHRCSWDNNFILTRDSGKFLESNLSSVCRELVCMRLWWLWHERLNGFEGLARNRRGSRVHELQWLQRQPARRLIPFAEFIEMVWFERPERVGLPAH